MQEQPDIQHVKTWQAPQLVELGDIADSTENGHAGPGADGAFTGDPSAAS